ncbi:hypothetical protein HaLaN_19055 [Haematococcus lacustris]|uniref:Uncharacterized protein n=1 Tax=Haematococcus lacustris TaxID=44745 RepID=A0A699ZTS4_HAELA|nr:hypothetical protein HaLaN_19055 [Haematococcus lacustris]
MSDCLAAGETVFNLPTVPGQPRLLFCSEHLEERLPLQCVVRKVEVAVQRPAVASGVPREGKAAATSAAPRRPASDGTEAEAEFVGEGEGGVPDPGPQPTPPRGLLPPPQASPGTTTSLLRSQPLASRLVTPLRHASPRPSPHAPHSSRNPGHTFTPQQITLSPHMTMRKDKLSPQAGGSRCAGQQGQVSSLRVSAAGVGLVGGLSVGAAGGCSGSKVWGAGQQDPYQYTASLEDWENQGQGQVGGRGAAAGQLPTGEGHDQGPSQEVAVSLLHMRRGVWEAGGKLQQSGPRGEVGCVGSESRGGGVGEGEEQGWVQANCSAVARSKRRARQKALAAELRSQTPPAMAIT